MSHHLLACTLCERVAGNPKPAQGGLNPSASPHPTSAWMQCCHTQQLISTHLRPQPDPRHAWWTKACLHCQAQLPHARPQGGQGPSSSLSPPLNCLDALMLATNSHVHTQSSPQPGTESHMLGPKLTCTCGCQAQIPKPAHRGAEDPSSRTPPLSSLSALPLSCSAC